MAARGLLLVLAAAVAAGSSAAAPSAYCCIPAELVASYDGDTQVVGGVVAPGPAHRLDVRASGTSRSIGAGPLVPALEGGSPVYAQVLFTCPKLRKPKPCATGSFWSTAVEVSVTIPQPKPLYVYIHITSNGTKTCDDTLGLLRKVIAEIKQTTSDAEHAKTLRDYKLAAAKQTTLLKAYSKARDYAKRVCA